MEWKDAIIFIEQEQRSNPSEIDALLWKRIQLGHRTQDLLMTIIAMKSLKEDTVSQSPEWQAAIKWIQLQKATRDSLIIDMVWMQLESGNRTDELFQLIQEQQTSNNHQ